MHYGWKIDDILIRILDAVNWDKSSKPTLAALSATCKCLYERPMDYLWADVTIFDVVTRSPQLKGLLNVSRPPDWTPLIKHAHRIRKFTFRASITLDYKILHSINEFFQSVADSRDTPLFPSLRSLTIDCYINAITDTLETWDCIRALSASGTLVELQLSIPLHIEVPESRSSQLLRDYLPDLLHANSSLKRLSCYNFRGPSLQNFLDETLPPEVQLEVHSLKFTSTWNLVDALASSAQLSTLAFRIPLPADSAKLPPSPGFNNLVVLHLTSCQGRPFTDSLASLQAIKSSDLTELELICESGWRDFDTAHTFFETISRFRRLSTFSLSTSMNAQSPTIRAPATRGATNENEFGFVDIVGPALSLAGMEVFTIQGYFRLNLDVKHLSAITSSWPRLRALTILPYAFASTGGDHGGEQIIPRGPPLRALEIFARYAPQLMDLRLVMESRSDLESDYVESLKEETFDGRMKFLFVSVPSLQQLPKTAAVANFLHVLYPKLTHAHFWDREVPMTPVRGDNTVPDGESHTVANWNRRLVDGLVARIATDNSREFWESKKS